MILEVGLLAESPLTDVTLERPRASVNVHVGFQVAGRGKRLGAHRALVGLFLAKKRKEKIKISIT